jgi:hypothetical protein
MVIIVTLSSELEALLPDRAAQRGQDVNFVASELLAGVLQWEEQDSEFIPHPFHNFGEARHVNSSHSPHPPCITANDW